MGLKGDCDLNLEWEQEHLGEESVSSVFGALEEGLGRSGPTIFTAVKDQLGLILETAGGPVEIIVIDGIARATPKMIWGCIVSTNLPGRHIW
jgi:uncharacterized protein (TIGR03435 family)